MAKAKAKRALVGNSTDEGQIANAVRISTALRAQQLDDLRALMATPQGARVVWRVLSQCHLFQPSMRDADAFSAFLEGERNIGLWLLAECELARPDAYLHLKTASHAQPIPDDASQSNTDDDDENDASA